MENIMDSKPWDFPEDTVAEIDKEPGVIDNAIIAEAYTETKGVPFNGCVDFQSIRELRLEFYDILRIEHLNICCNLTNLSLSNNVIKEIAHLNKLVHLVKLNLSFNKITTIKNLEGLTKLEELSLFSNRIAVVENLEAQTESLHLLSLGNNCIETSSSLTYLRKFRKLASVNFEGNPFVKQFEGKMPGIVGAVLPQVVYYNYAMVRPEQREEGIQLVRSQIDRLLEIEAQLELLSKMREFAAKISLYMTNAFIIGFNGDEFHNNISSKDPEEIELHNISETVNCVYKRLKDGWKNSSETLVKLGITFYDRRKTEVKEYVNVYTEDMQAITHNCTVVIREFYMSKNEYLKKLRDLYNEKQIDESKAETNLRLAITIDKDFTAAKRKAWWDLMEQEMIRHDRNEDNLAHFEKKLLEMERDFMEKVQIEFYNMRQLEEEFVVSLRDQVNRFLVAVYLNDEPRRSILYDEDTVRLINEKRSQIINDSHKNHLSQLEAEEEKILNKIKNWRTSLIGKFGLAEIDRNRQAVVNVNRFISHHKREFIFQTRKPMSNAYHFIEAIDPQWVDEMRRIKMDSKAREKNDRIEAIRRERFQAMVMCKNMQLQAKGIEEADADEIEEFERVQKNHLEKRAKSKAYRLAYATLIRRDTQLESIFEKWESIENLSDSTDGAFGIDANYS